MKSYEAFKALGQAIQADLETATPTQIADLIHELKYWENEIYLTSGVTLERLEFAEEA